MAQKPTANSWRDHDRTPLAGWRPRRPGLLTALAALLALVAAILPNTAASTAATTAGGSEKPTVVLVHGAFADASGCGAVATKLQHRGVHRVGAAEPAAWPDRGAVITNAWRNLKRIPELAIFAILPSVMFVLLSAFVFGGAIPLPGGGSYREFLMPGIFAQTLAFAAATTAIGMTDDMAKGLIDRFRSLPMARSAFLTGRTVSDVVYNGGILVVLMLSGLAVGWRVRDGLVSFVAGTALALLFAYAMSPSEHPVLLALIWTAAFIAVFAPLGVRRYRATSH